MKYLCGFDKNTFFAIFFLVCLAFYFPLQTILFEIIFISIQSDMMHFQHKRMAAIVLNEHAWKCFFYCFLCAILRKFEIFSCENEESRTEKIGENADLSITTIDDEKLIAENRIS